MRGLWLAAALFVASDATSAQEPSSAPGELRISNFVFGTICRRDEETGAVSAEIGVDADGDICEATKVPIRGRGRCMYAGEEKPCTWFGFEFDFENKDPEEPITCTWTRSVPADEGTTVEVTKRGIMSDTFDLRIGDDTSGHYRNPMYWVYRPQTAPWIVADMDLNCRYRGQPVVETQWKLIFSSAFE